MSELQRPGTWSELDGDEGHLLWLARNFGDPEYVPLTVRDLEALEVAVTVEHFGTGARLYRECEPADRCFLLRSGTVDLVREGRSPTIKIWEAGEGDVIGDEAMCRGGVHSSTAVARSPVAAIEFCRDRTIEALAMYPRIGLRWLFSAFERAELVNQRLSVLLSGSVKERLAAYLLVQSTDTILMTHRELADVLGAERATVSRAIKALRSQGAIANGRGRIEVLDRNALEANSGADCGS